MVIGNIGRDPEVRFTNDNRAIANLTLATTDTWKDQSGQKQERTEWHRVAVFGPLAEIIQKYVKKGDSIYFEGRLQTRKWTGQDGQERYTTEIVVDGRGGVMQMLGGRGGSSGASSNYDDNFDQTQPATGSTMKPTKVSDDAAFDDDIPF